MHWATVYAADRRTFLMAADGKLCRKWRKVKLKRNADEILAAVQELGR